MKRLTVLSLSLLTLLLSPYSYAVDKPEKCGEVFINSLEGEAKIIRNGQTLEAKVDLALQENDKIQAGETGIVDVSINQLAGCRVMPGGESTIISAQQDMQVQINKGKTLINLRKLPKGSSFKVETPTAIAAVRGTQFLADAAGSSSTFAVRDGIVDVTTISTGQSFSLSPGQALEIPVDLTGVLSVRPALGSELAVLDQASSIKTC